jgi:DnaJ-domain-containing protein 1
MRRYWGALAGLTVGALGGVGGALFGLVMGGLCDLVLVEHRAGRAALRFLDRGDRPTWLPAIVVLTGALHGHLQPHAGGVDSGALERITTRLRPLYPDRWAHRAIERMILTAAAHEWIGADRFTALVREQRTELRELLFATVWAALRASESAAGVRDTVHDLARRAGIDEGFIQRELVVRELLDPDACAVLGIPRDADQDAAHAAYRRLAAQFHPDTAAFLSDTQRRATEHAFKRVQAAYDTVRATADRR